MRYSQVPLLCFFLSCSVFAQEGEYSVEIYFQPDDSGMNTLNKTIELEDGELTIEESRVDGNNLYQERDATAEEIRLIVELVRQRLDSFELETGEDVDRPRIEVQLEFDGEDRSLEVEEVYGAGQLPALFIRFQQAFFASIFE